MALIDRIPVLSRLLGRGNKRSYPNPYNNTIFQANNLSGEVVTERTALNFSAVYACVKIISETIASLPLSVLKTTENGKELAPKHPLYNLIHNEPSDLFSSYNWRIATMMHVGLWGNNYQHIIRNKSGRPIKFVLLDPSRTDPVIVDGELFYDTKIKGDDTTRIPARDILHFSGLSFDGIKGQSPIATARENIGMGLAAQSYGAEFFSNGCSLSGTLRHPSTLKEEAHNRLKNSWNTQHSGRGRRHGVAILEEGMEFTPISIPPEDAQFIETRKFQIEEIARIYRVPPHMLGQLDRATFSNIESQNLEFYKATILPYLVSMEQELNRKLLREDEKGVYYTKFKIQALLRGDSASRSEFYNKMFNIGVFSQNDIRGFEDMNKIEGGDRYFIPLNMTDKEDVQGE